MCANQVRDQSRQTIVVTKSNLLNGNRIVFVNNWDYAHLKQLK